MSTIPIGECIDLRPYYENLSRRDFLKLGSGAVAGSLGLSTPIENAYGARPDGTPSVAEPLFNAVNVSLSP